MFKKLSPSELRASIIPFNHIFMTEDQFEEFKKHSREHKTSEDYTIIREPLPTNPKPPVDQLGGNIPSEK